MLNTIRNHQKFVLLRRRRPSIVDESNHNGTEQKSFLEHTIVQTEIIFTLRKDGGYRTSGLGGRSFPVVRQAGRQKYRCLRKL